MDESARKIERGHMAKAMMESEAFQSTINDLLQRYVDAWIAGKSVEAREDAHRYVTVIGLLKNDLRSMAMTGDLTRQRLEVLEGGKQTLWSKLNG